jgi:hypothetical protein
MNGSRHFALFASLLLFHNLTSSLEPAGAMSPAAAQCGITDTIEQIGLFIAAVKQFFTLLAGIFSVTGLNTLVLFFAVVIISSGLSALGIPRGKSSFVLSLAAADAFWFAWERGLGTEIPAFLPAMIKSNLLLLLPLALVALASAAAPHIRRLPAVATSLLRRKKHASPPADQALNRFMEIDRRMHALRGCCIRDIKEGFKGAGVAFSPETLAARDELVRALRTMPGGKPDPDEVMINIDKKTPGVIIILP